MLSDLQYSLYDYVLTLINKIGKVDHVLLKEQLVEGVDQLVDILINE